MVADKIVTYLAAGTVAVIVVDPQGETMIVHDRHGARVLHGDQPLTHPALPGFTIDVGAFFVRAKR
jgi:hypothetical protein